jgi:hypothetical protein
MGERDKKMNSARREVITENGSSNAGTRYLLSYFKMICKLARIGRRIAPGQIGWIPVFPTSCAYSFYPLIVSLSLGAKINTEKTAKGINKPPIIKKGVQLPPAVSMGTK